MGQNKRYAEYYAKRMEKQITEVLIRPKPISLSEDELDREHNPVTQAQRPIPIRAWARYPETPARVEGRAIAWTERAVQIEWEDVRGETHRAWVWAGAVDKL
ncbi:hypothetical protein [Mycetocola zhujimingii]|uniref:hypothetical protein n=1 Tax=Mycetocola zhujimingii TaxID=2079792 RepID=UPI0013C406F8|nr:hypothetical protein [Mycetocola zhujimingii]